MLAYIIRRLASTVLVMGIVAVFVFLLLHLSPGDPAAIIAGDNATGDQIAAIRRQLGLDDALPVHPHGRHLRHRRLERARLTAGGILRIVHARGAIRRHRSDDGKPREEDADEKRRPHVP